ncbi:conjugal transfer protein TraH [Roseibium sediminicola]|uniref:Conjugal transfer protein TraH n=1 Tax=Roseibium sediminicola TaxID=2933272 RepID=A0ABT0H232_9HYPH|nr:conjugal transfer protein TraH [Roseibium sp. CAU 1639]MCK7615734.1 conjugal transfer protein TraH [Roseibium sp. CAU 1639]
MLDAALIDQCADPSLKPAIIEEFIAAAGSEDSLNVTVRTGSKTFLVPKPKSPQEAVKLVQDHLGKAVVRVGITQYPIGIGISDKSQVSADVFDTCNNIKIGTALFALVYRVVTKWYGTPVQEAFEDAIEAYQTGYFDGEYVFTVEDPGESVGLAAPEPAALEEGGLTPDTENTGSDPKEELRQRLWAQDPNKADISVDLTGIGDFNRE